MKHILKNIKGISKRNRLFTASFLNTPLWKIGGILFLFSFSFSCANIVALQGGAKDTTSPQLIEEESTKNYQTNFTQRSFELSFDEWLQLKDKINQVVVSPPLQYRADIRLKKKKVLFTFEEKEELRTAATYVVNFGDAIADYTEGNPAKMIFVFSTGDYIDSLEVGGTIIDAFSKEPVKDVLVMLYDNMADSVVRTERPFYFGKTDDKGVFQIKNIKSDTFKVMALVDDNLNYLYDNESEKISFLDTTIFLTDSFNSQINLRLFQETKKLSLRANEQDDYGLVNLVFNQEAEGPNIFYDNFDQFTFWEVEKDTVHFWYDIAEEQNWNIYFQRDTLIDTVEVNKRSKIEWQKKAKLKFESFNQTAFDYAQSLYIKFNYPLKKIDTTLILILEDSLAIPISSEMNIDSVHKRQLNIKYTWRQGMPYEILFLPNALTDAFGWQNSDTLRQAHKTALEKDFGNLLLKFENLAADTAYIVKLLDKSEEIINQFSIQDTTIFERSITKLLPGSYSIQLIEDLNRDGKWTTGSYDLKRHPERVFTQALEEVRAQWDVEATISGEAFE